MPVPPLPDVPVVRCALDYSSTSSKFGSRFFLSYTGGGLSGADCSALAQTISDEWGTHIAPQVQDAFNLDQVDVLDIATRSGLSGQSATGSVGTRTAGGPLPVQCSTNVEFGIARRYRGGKPRMYFPPGGASDLYDPSLYASAFVTAMNTAVSAFFAAVLAGAPGAGTPWKHVSLSLYQGTEGVIYDSGHEGRTDPTYKSTATHDDITGYFTKQVVGSQRRRRLSTTY